LEFSLLFSTNVKFLAPPWYQTGWIGLSSLIELTLLGG